MKNYKKLIIILLVGLLIMSGCSKDIKQIFTGLGPRQMKEKGREIKDYGEKIKVKDNWMNIYTAGSGDKTIVVLPGLGEFSQVYSHHNLINSLSQTYKLVVVEPFGYGLSDIIDEARTIDNITEEIHEAISQLGLENYILMGHSIAGIYGLKYVDRYPNEVLGFIGLDTSTPTMHGKVRLDVEPSSIRQTREIQGVDKEINDQYKLIARKIAGNKNNADESKRSYDNIQSVKDLKFSKDFPALYFLGQENVDDFDGNLKEVFQVEMGWVEQHEALSTDPDDVEIHVLDDGHFLYERFYDEIAEKINVFVQRNNIYKD